MDRRRVLTFGGTAFGIAFAGCLGDHRPGDDDPPGSPSPSPEETPVRIESRAAQPDAPVEFDAEIAESPATAERPARIRVTVTNPTASPVALGEERTVQFRHVSSADGELYLHPADDSAWEDLVEPGCWRLTEHVAVPEYYGSISLEAGESIEAESHVLGHPNLPEDDCLPGGPHPIAIEGVAAEDEAGLENGTEFEWGFTVRVGT